MQRGGGGGISDDSDMDDDMPESSSQAHDPKKHARAQHNALERRRRDNIKDMYSYLRETVPDMQNERASRAMILRKAIEVIEDKQKQYKDMQDSINAVKAENDELEKQVRALLEAKSAEIQAKKGGQSPQLQQS